MGFHLWAGFPCTDLSKVKFQRLNFEGPNSSLFWEGPRVQALLEEVFGPMVQRKHALENVASMDEEAATQISDAIGSTPYLLDPCQAVPMRRPQFVWLSVKLEDTSWDITITQGRYWKGVEVAAEYPPTSSRLEPGHQWDGEQVGAILPTCIIMKSIPRLRPPPPPSGLAKCDFSCQQRWAGDDFRYPPYQYD